MIEGLYMGMGDAAESPEWAEVSSLIDFHIFVSVPEEVSTARVIRRHMQVWGISRTDAALRAQGSDLQNAKLINDHFQKRPRCIADNDTVFPQDNPLKFDTCQHEMPAAGANNLTIAPVHHVITSVDDEAFASVKSIVD